MSDLVLGTATAAKSGSTVTVNVNGTTTTMQVARDLTVANGDLVLVGKFGSQWFVVQRYFTAAGAGSSNDPPPPPKPPVVSGQLTVAPVETRSYRTVFNGWRTDTTSVYQGQYGGNGNHTGCAFYGNAPRSLHGATVTSASIHVQRLSGGVYAPQPSILRLVTEAFRPAGAPTLGASTGGPSLAVGATNNSYGLLVSWAQAMVDGTAGGLAVFDSDGSPYIRFAGTGDWSPAFSMTITWRR